MKETKICCLCGKPIFGYSHNPRPVAKEGECCNDCNATKVIPARLKKMKEGNNEE